MKGKSVDFAQNPLDRGADPWSQRSPCPSSWAPGFKLPLCLNSHTHTFSQYRIVSSSEPSVYICTQVCLWPFVYEKREVNVSVFASCAVCYVRMPAGKDIVSAQEVWGPRPTTSDWFSDSEATNCDAWGQVKMNSCQASYIYVNCFFYHSFYFWWFVFGLGSADCVGLVVLEESH